MAHPSVLELSKDIQKNFVKMLKIPYRKIRPTPPIA